MKDLRVGEKGEEEEEGEKKEKVSRHGETHALGGSNNTRARQKGENRG